MRIGGFIDHHQQVIFKQWVSVVAVWAAGHRRLLCLPRFHWRLCNLRGWPNSWFRLSPCAGVWISVSFFYRWIPLKIFQLWCGMSPVTSEDKGWVAGRNDPVMTQRDRNGVWSGSWTEPWFQTFSCRGRLITVLRIFIACDSSLTESLNSDEKAVIRPHSYPVLVKFW